MTTVKSDADSVVWGNCTEVPTGPNVADAQFAMYHAICEVTMRCVGLNPLRYLLPFAINEV